MKYDVIVVGSGPAGASAALHLAKHGVKVALLEKESLPRYKPCGGGIVYRAIRSLPVDIKEVVDRYCYSVEFHLLNSGLHYGYNRREPIVFMVMRDRFDNLIVEAAKEAGAEILTKCAVQEIKLNRSHVELRTSQSSFTTRFVIAADGALSSVARKTGWQETRHLIPALECEVSVDHQTFERYSQSARFDFDLIPDGYAWSFPKSNHLSLGVLSMNRGKINLNDMLKRYLRVLKIARIERIERHGFLIPVSPRKDTYIQKRVLLAGDAAGFADPITAEGISVAILSGQIAADAIVQGHFEENTVRLLFEAELQTKILADLNISKLLANFIYKSNKIRTTLFRLYGPKLVHAMTQVFLGEKSYKDLLRNPVNYLKLLKSGN